jgi:S1/P1 Nuclease
MRNLVLACLIQLALLAQAHAWGPEGHSIVAEIAQRRLSPEAAAKVREILGENASLASIASWADDYRALHLDSAGWHFVNIPLAADDYEESRDCAPSPQGDCVIHELARSLRDLTDPALTPAQRRDALKFVVHLVGDVNQPLHTVGELRGYNDLAVCYFSSQAKNDCVPTICILFGTWVSSVRCFGIGAAMSTISRRIGSQPTTILRLIQERRSTGRLRRTRRRETSRLPA